MLVIGSKAEPIAKFSGTYRYTRYAQTSMDKLAVLIGSALCIHSPGDFCNMVIDNSLANKRAGYF